MYVFAFQSRDQEFVPGSSGISDGAGDAQNDRQCEEFQADGHSNQPGSTQGAEDLVQ